MSDVAIDFVDIDRHCRPNGLRFTLDVDGASPEDIVRGINAARRVFMEADLSPYAAACAVFYVEAEDEDFPVMPEHVDWFGKWNQATDAALSAVCANMPKGTRVTYVMGQTWDGAPDPIVGDHMRAWYVVS